MRKKIFILGVIAMAAGQACTYATSSVSVATLPQGMVSIAAGAVGSTTYISLPLSSNATYRGLVSSVGSSTIGVSGTPFKSTLASAAAPYFVKMVTGAETGRTLLITANSTSSLTVSITDNSSQQTPLTASSFAVAVGDSFEIVPGDTLSSIFGANTKASPLMIAGAASYATADWVNVFNPTTSSWQIFFFNTTYNYWTLEGSTANADNTVLYPYSGLSITRHAATEPATALILTGRVTQVPVMVKTTGSNAINYVSTGYPIGMTLSQLNLGANWVKGTSIATADVVSVWNSSTRTFVSYFQEADSSWHLASSPTADQSSTLLPPGGCIAIQQHLSVSGSTSYLPSSMPYTVSNSL